MVLQIYKWCYWYPVLKCRELLNRGVLNRGDHCIVFGGVDICFTTHSKHFIQWCYGLYEKKIFTVIFSIISKEETISQRVTILGPFYRRKSSSRPARKRRENRLLGGKKSDAFIWRLEPAWWFKGRLHCLLQCGLSWRCLVWPCIFFGIRKFTVY